MNLSFSPIRTLLTALAFSTARLQAQAPAPATAAPVPQADAPAAVPKSVPTSAAGVTPTAVPRRPRVRTPRADQPAFNPNLVLLDPAHGGSDKGSAFGADAFEKDINLAFAKRLRGLLAGKGFNVVFTRESDPAVPSSGSNASDSTDSPAPPAPPPVVVISSDARAEVANRSHAVACLILHTTSTGHGVHLYTSSLSVVPPVVVGPDRPITPWDTAQAAYLTQSARMATDMTQPLNGLQIPVLSGRVSLGPMDSMSCPVVALEIAPLAVTRGSTSLPSDDRYQQRIAEAVVEGLVHWREHAQNDALAMAAATHTTTPEKAPKPHTRPRKPKAPVLNPDGTAQAPSQAPGQTPSQTPGQTPAPAKRPAPVIRQAPAAPPQATPPGGAR